MSEKYWQRYLIEISFDGTHYHGYQTQPNVISIQEVIEEKMSILFQEKISITGASRTDAGVHIAQTFAHFDVDKPLPKLFLRRVNFMLPDDICIKNIYIVPNTTHSRFDAIQRSYQYFLHYKKNPFLINKSYYFPYLPLDIQLLNEAAAFVQTQNDFASFCKRNSQVKTTICRIDNAHWEFDESRQQLVFSISADRYLRGMVRGLVGTMIKVGNQHMALDTFKSIFTDNLKNKVDFAAPGCGLYLTEVKYPEHLLTAQNRLID